MSSIKKPAKKSEKDFLKPVKTAKPEPASPDYPWNDPGLKNEGLKRKTFRLPAETLVKLNWVAAHTERSAEGIIRHVLKSYIDEQIEKLTG
jgi:hypothetical protein